MTTDDDDDDTAADLPATRPRWRALAAPWYDHDPDDRVHKPTYRHEVGCEAGCEAGYELTIYRVDAAWRAAAPGRAHEPVGTTQVPAPLDPAVAADAVRDWVRAASAPHRVGEPVQVEVYRRLEDETPRPPAELAALREYHDTHDLSAELESATWVDSREEEP